MQQFHQRLPQILQSLEMQLQKEEETKSKRAKKKLRKKKQKTREICIAPNSVFLIFRILSAQNDSFHPKIYVIKCNYM